MDEQSIGAALQTYRAQLEQVELTLRAGPDPSQQADLAQLQGDLQQLIELTESSLLSMQKSKLLSALDKPSASSHQDEEYVAFTTAIGEMSEEPQPSGANGETAEGPDGSEEEQEGDADETSGVKVKAPYYSTWGTLEYHNAMIVGSEQTESGGPGVRVLYLYPTHKAMKPCPYFLDGKCRFLESCRFSHGQVVSVDELQPFAEPDLSTLGLESPCLARHGDGLWYTARIIDIDSGFYTVKFDSQLLKDSVLEADALLPPLRGSDSSSSSDEDEVGGAEDSGYAKVLGVEEASGDTPCSSAFAGWEAHTRGIGSKLLVRMGYEFGKGLGRNAEGRVEPIVAVVLPKGKSLDQCAEIQRRKRGGRQDPSSKPRRRRVKPAGQGRVAKTRPNVFDFLNEKLEGRLPGGQPGGAQGSTDRRGKDLYHASQGSKRALSVRLAQASEKVQQKQREMGRLTEALARNVGRESVVSAQLELRLSCARTELATLQQDELSLQRERKKADTHKKMTEF